MTGFTAADRLEVPLEPVPAQQVVEGAPAAGFVALGVVAGQEYGVWEMTPGAMSDTEADEVFTIIGGRGTVVIDGRMHVLEPGVTGRFDAGTETVWTVTETLRKTYVTPAS